MTHFIYFKDFPVKYQVFELNGKQLKDSWKVGDIEHKGYLNLVLKRNGIPFIPPLIEHEYDEKKFSIFALFLAIPFKTIEVESSDTIEVLKLKVESLTGKLLLSFIINKAETLNAKIAY